MSIADKGKTVLELAADYTLDGRFFVRAVRFSQLNPEQQLAYMMEQLIVLAKQKLQLLEAVNIAAKEYVEWRKTPEGQAWMAKMAAKRAEQDGEKVSSPRTFDDYWRDASDGCSDAPAEHQEMLKAWARAAWDAS